MARLYWAIALVSLAASAAHADSAITAASTPIPSWTSIAPPSWTISYASEARFYAWQGTRGYPTYGSTAAGSGSEIYIPFALQATGTPSSLFKLDLTLRGGWVHAEQATPGLSGEVSTTTDTVASGTITYLGIRGIQPFIGINTNLPTGRSALFGTATNARMDPDLVEISNFGEGFNLGPTVGANVPLNSALLATFSFGYTWHGTFEQESTLMLELPVAQAPTWIKPSEDFTWTGALNYASGPWVANLTGSLAKYTTTFINGTAFVQPGLRFLLSGTVAYQWPKTLGTTTVAASGSHSLNNDVQFLTSPPGLTIEPFDSNSNLYLVSVQHLVPIGRFAVGPSASFLYRDHNGYDPDTLQFVPQKQRYEVGVLAQYAANDRITFDAHLDHVWTHEDDNPAPGGFKDSVYAGGYLPASYIPSVSSVAWQGAVGINISF